MPPLIIGGALVAGGLIAQGIATNDAANAQQGIANAQLSQAQADRNTALSFSTPSTAELELMNKQYAMQDSALKRQEQLLSAIDPAFMEAGRQALKLLRGEDAATLKPFNDQREQDRSKLISRLNDQMGPGAESSSAGLEALRQFDLGTAGQKAKLQQDSLGQLFSAALAGKPNPNDLINANLNTIGVQQRQQQMAISALTGTSFIKNAGAPFAGDAARAEGLSGMGKTIGGLGASVIGGGMGGVAGGGGTGTAGLSSNEVADLQSNIGQLNSVNSGTP